MTIRTSVHYFPAAVHALGTLLFIMETRGIFSSMDLSAATTFKGEVSKGPSRIYYKITEEGRTQLEQLRTDWKDLQNIITEMGI